MKCHLKIKLISGVWFKTRMTAPAAVVVAAAAADGNT